MVAVLGVLFLVFGAALAVGGVQRYRGSRAFLTVASRVPGVVVRTHVVETTDSYEYFPVLRFRTTDGIDVETVGGTNSGSFELLRLRGRPVWVLYDPANPSQARIDTPSGRALGGSVAMVVAGCVFALIGALVLML